MKNDKKRCGWVGIDPLYVAYHDVEWGVPVHDNKIFYYVTQGFEIDGLLLIKKIARRVGFSVPNVPSSLLLSILLLPLFYYLFYYTLC
jgi:hypothetical protein